MAWGSAWAGLRKNWKCMSCRRSTRLRAGGANVAPGVIDESLNHWIHQHGDVQVLVYRGPDAGGTYPLKEGRQGEGENLPLEDLSQRAQVRGGLPLLGPGED